MVVRAFRLILLLSFLGRQVHAVPHPQGEGGPEGQQHGGQREGQHPKPFQQPPENTERVIMATPTTAAPVVAVASPQAAQGDAVFASSTQSTDTLGPSSIEPTTSQTSTAIPSSTAPSFTWFESNWNAPQSFNENVPEPVLYQIQSIPSSVSGGVIFDPVVFVCQTNATDLTQMNSSNTWSVAQLPLVSGDPHGNGNIVTNSAQFQSDNSGTPNPNTLNYFFCLAHRSQYINDFVCNSFGPSFSINGQRNHGLAPRQEPPVSPVTGMPTSVLSIINYSGTLSAMGQSIFATATVITSATSTSLAQSGTIWTTVTPTPTASIVLTSVPASHSGLSTGAKVGIALGALVLVALLLLGALFFLRRKHRSRSPPPEQVMLTRDLHTDSFSRSALIAEKENSTRHSVATAAPTEEHLPIQRHSTPSPTPYDTMPAASYSEPVSEPPRRKPTNASAVSRISGPASPRSVTVSTPPDEYEEYRDQPMPVYGDARHSPRVYSTEERQGVQAPFLTEEGMSAEEVARLEEEERRIDAAIAEAERSGRR